MDLDGEIKVKFAICGEKAEEIGVESLQLDEEMQTLMTVPLETGSSFTALLKLPANQAVKLLYSPVIEETTANTSGEAYPSITVFPSNMALIDRASKFAVFAATENSPEKNSIPVNSSANCDKVKLELADSDWQPNSSRVMSDQIVAKSKKRKEREKKVKGSAKKSKRVANETTKDDGKLPYVHVRARRGQATDSHSLAERARREKINARMKLLQELVPGCNKISGTAMVLDEIINHVQSLQRQVEFLSMRLATVNPEIDINLDSPFTAESGSLMDCNFPSMVMRSLWLEGQLHGNRQQYQQLWHFDGLHQPVWGREEANPNFITPENSLLSYDSGNSAPLHRNQLKMEL